ncbi:putative aspartic peptidase domain superfamily [Helianthus annuus]|nr:putative aspartic peptidase domain superfamily [Helianthus annuus]
MAHSPGNKSIAPGAHKVDESTSLQAQIEALFSKIKKLEMTKTVSVMACEGCGGSHENWSCMKETDDQQEMVNYIDNRPRPSGPPTGTYNQGWRNHPNLGWRETGNSSNQQTQRTNFQQSRNESQNFTQQQSGRERLEDTISRLVSDTDKKNSERFLQLESNFRNQQASIQNIEKQINQLAQNFSERPQGALPSNTETNPKAQVHLITLRNRTVGPAEVPPPTEETMPTHLQEKNSPPSPEPTKAPRVPYPGRLIRQKTNEQFTKFESLLKQLHVNIPFIEVLTQMPKYSKFMRDFLTHKKKIENLQLVNLGEECSALVLNKLPQKKIDPGSFTIPCSIGESPVRNALADLGASINLMPSSMFKRLGLGITSPTKISIQLADRSVKFPQGVIENVLVRVSRFVYPVDFVILDMEEDTEVPLILGRPFLATAQAVVDMNDGTLTLRYGDDEVKFGVGKRIEDDDPVNYMKVIDSSLDAALRRCNLGSKALHSEDI